MFKQLIVIIVLFTSTLVYAESIMPTGNGTEQNPYRISCWENVEWLSTNMNIWDDELHFIQTCDISFENEQGSVYHPIGSWSIPFKGIYDGNSYSILNLSINIGTITGLFGVIEDSVIKNLTLSNISFTTTTNGNTGGIAVSATNSEIVNCHVDGVIIGNYYCGGIVSTINNGTTIQQCSSHLDISGAFYACGGIVGFSSDSLVSDCYYMGCINNSLGNCGGLVGINNPLSELVNSYAFINNSSGNAYSLSGQNEGSIANSVWNSNNPVTGAVPANTIGSVVNVMDLNEQEMRDISSYLYLGWDFINETENGEIDLWNIDSNENNGFPFHPPYSPVAGINEIVASINNLNLSLFPNPFYSNTTIKITNEISDTSILTIYNIKGQVIRSFNCIKAKEIIWNGVDKNNRQCPSGIYLCRLESNHNKIIKKVILFR